MVPHGSFHELKAFNSPADPGELRVLGSGLPLALHLVRAGASDESPGHLGDRAYSDVVLAGLGREARLDLSHDVAGKTAIDAILPTENNQSLPGLTSLLFALLPFWVSFMFPYPQKLLLLGSVCPSGYFLCILHLVH